jgi:hypothetical protein
MPSAIPPGSPIQPMRFGDLDFQRTPGWPEFPEYSVDVVSAMLPCGVAWVASCLFELGVALWKPWNANTQDEWTPLGDRRFRYACPGDPWRRMIPAMISGRTFTFRATPVPRFTHVWPDQSLPAARRLLVMRDPRDALYSEWIRYEKSRGNSNYEPASFLDFALDHADPMRGPRVSYWDRFYGSWMETMTPERDLVLRFEDFKTAPNQSLATVCKFLDLPASSAQIEAAIRNSDFVRVAAIDQEMVNAGLLAWTINRAGKVNEYQSAMTPEMKAVFSCHSPLWQALGYLAH